jgi:hypothetical protein
MAVGQLLAHAYHHSDFLGSPHADLSRDPISNRSEFLPGTA